MLYCIFVCIGIGRFITMHEKSVTKRFDITGNKNEKWLMGNEHELFYREAKIHLHIREKKHTCKINKVPELLYINFQDYSITSTYVGEAITKNTMTNICKNISFTNIQMQINEMKSFFNCSGIVLCDVKPKNIAVLGNQLYVFDFDAAFFVNDKRIQSKICTHNFDSVQRDFHECKFT
jgi:tRNA A-37 threonylcarbamoyl transferase component Bud32